MRTLLAVVVLCFCFCGSSAFADNALIKTGNTAFTSTVLDTGTTDTGVIGSIIKALNRMDAWIQENLW